jgi:DNA (cytosine-5)-methyltransferase 1
VIGAVELNNLAASTYRRNFPRTRLWHSDIRSVTVAEMMRTLKLAKGDLDLLAACPPCQGFSTIRTLNGHASAIDPRNDLVLQLVRFVRQMHPKTVLVENVPGLADDRRIRELEHVLEENRYRLRSEIIDAADYGVPQRRRRFLLVATRMGEVPSKPRPTPRTTVRDAIGSLGAAGRSGDPLHDHGENRSAEVRERIARIPKNGGSRSDLPKNLQLSCHRRGHGFKDVYGRMAWNDVAPTLTCGFVNPSKGRFLHPDKNRSITLREAALLQTFPKKHYFSLEEGKYSAAELIGNALPPRLVAAQARSFLRHLRESEKGS